MLPPNKQRQVFAALADAACGALSFVLALSLRLGEHFVAQAGSYVAPGAAAFALVLVALLVSTRAYRRVWRYSSLKDLTDLMKASGLAILIFYLLMFQFTRLELVPRSLPVIHALVLVAMLTALRLGVRLGSEKSRATAMQPVFRRRVPVLLVGANDLAELFIRESQRNAQFTYEVVGLVDSAEPATMVGKELHHRRVYGPLAHMPQVLRKLDRKGRKPQKIIVADPHLNATHIQSLLAIAEEEGVALARMPRLTDFKRGGDKLAIRAVDLEDLLGRPQTTLDIAAMRQVIEGRVVLVTGAGGSIGSELCRQIAAGHPQLLVLVEQSEYALYLIERELGEQFPSLNRRAMLADVRNRSQMDDIFRRLRPEIVFHAAALKHVPLCEANPLEAMETNIIGTRIVSQMVQRYNVPLMVNISTDKAVHPSNMLGACKRAAELICLQTNAATASSQLVTVRFGNVLGSTGSVIPLFQHQLAQGGPLTVTHPDMTRFFMTIREAVQLVLQSAVLAKDEPGRDGVLYVLNMGEPVKIEDLAMQLIRLAGLRPRVDIAIEHTGLRTGEKLNEELFYAQEEQLTTANPGILKAGAKRPEAAELSLWLDELEEALAKRDEPRASRLLKQLVPEFQPATHLPKGEAA